MNTKKITKRDNFESLISMVAWMKDNVGDENWDYVTLDTFLGKEIENLDKKADAAKVRAAKQKEKGDALREDIYNTLDTEDFLTIPEIIKALNDDDVTPQKVTPRLTHLIDAKRVEKGDVQVPSSSGGKSRKLVGYRAIG